MSRPETERDLTGLKYLDWYLSLSEMQRIEEDARMQASTNQYLQAVKNALLKEGLITDPGRFDEIADQIEVTAPNNDAALKAGRMLGRWYTGSRRGIVKVLDSLRKGLEGQK